MWDEGNPWDFSIPAMAVRPRPSQFFVSMIFHVLTIERSKFQNSFCSTLHSISFPLERYRANKTSPTDRNLWTSRCSVFDKQSNFHDNIVAARIPPGPGERKFILSSDRAGVFTTRKCRAFCAENGLGFVTDRQFPLDLAPSDCFLFRDAKDCLQGRTFHQIDAHLGQLSK